MRSTDGPSDARRRRAACTTTTEPTASAADRCRAALSACPSRPRLRPRRRPRPVAARAASATGRPRCRTRSRTPRDGRRGDRCGRWPAHRRWSPARRAWTARHASRRTTCRCRCPQLRRPRLRGGCAPRSCPSRPGRCHRSSRAGDGPTRPGKELSPSRRSRRSRTRADRTFSGPSPAPRVSPCCPGGATTRGDARTAPRERSTRRR